MSKDGTSLCDKRIKTIEFYNTKRFYEQEDLEYRMAKKWYKLKNSECAIHRFGDDNKEFLEKMRILGKKYNFSYKKGLDKHEE